MADAPRQTRNTRIISVSFWPEDLDLARRLAAEHRWPLSTWLAWLIRQEGERRAAAKRRRKQ